MASWGSLGHMTVAEPEALVGFLGTRVYEALHGETFPEGVQTSENLYAHGLIDGVVEPEAFCQRVGSVLRHELSWLRRQDVTGLVANRAVR